MSQDVRYIVGTSGYSFADWVGQFYPAGTQQKDMFSHYVKHFEAAELNFTFYRIPTARTLDAIARKSPDGFEFWVKANRAITHKHDTSVVGEFLENLAPLTDAGKLAGVLLQFPQSFHRTVASRSFLAEALEAFESVPAAVEFRHNSWDDPGTVAGLTERNVTLVIPDVPPIASLYSAAVTATTSTGYLRLHSRDADMWYAGAAERYDYSYTDKQMRALLDDWSKLAGKVDKVYAFFNNCHRAQAAANAEAFRRILGQIK